MNCQGAKSKINKLTGCISLLALVCLTLMLTYCKEKPFASQSLRFVLPITINPSASAANRGEGYDNIPNIYAEQKGTFTFEVK